MLFKLNELSITFGKNVNMKKRKILLVTLLMLGFIRLYSQSYQYKVNLTEIKKDKLRIELACPAIQQDSILFQFPAIIPGHYSWVNYGRFVDKLQAFTSAHAPLIVERKGVNSFLIKNATELSSIVYEVEDTQDSKQKEKVYGWSATDFKKSDCFLINTGGLFGFFEGLTDIPVGIAFTKPTHLVGSSSLPLKKENSSIQEYLAKDYHQLIDCPILFAHPDTAEFSVGETKIKVACYNEAGVNVAEYIAAYIKPQIQALDLFADGELPVDNYTFIFYLEDFTNAKNMIYEEKITKFKMLRKIILKHGMPMPGALEHSNSSVHSLLFTGEKFSLNSMLDRTIIHEFLHIYVPLNLHSERTGNFSYMKPIMTKHLWLYEGVTEYLTVLAKIQSGLVDLDTGIQDLIRPKIVESHSFPEDMIITEMSENVFNNASFNSAYMQVYDHGAILALVLDLEIIRLTQGTKNLKQIVFQLCNRYGQFNSFREDEIIDEIIEMVHPDLRNFFDMHITGNQELDISGSLESIGVEYTFKEETKVPYTILDGGYGVLDVIEAFGLFTINEASSDSPFRAKDKIRSNDLGKNARKPFVSYDNGEFIEDTISIQVYRDSRWIELEITPEYKQGIYYFKMWNNPSKSASQETLFRKWLE